VPTCTFQPSLSTASTKTDKTFDLRLVCGHKLSLTSRPNPRKRWPDPQTCPTCNKKQRVVELYSPKAAVSRLTSPLAPAKYKKALESGKR
jgi:hypothetical protein